MKKSYKAIREMLDNGKRKFNETETRALRMAMTLLAQAFIEEDTPIELRLTSVIGEPTPVGAGIAGIAEMLRK